MNGRRVFITGAAGFVGSWLTESLLTLGARVYALVWPGDDESHWWSFLDQADVEVVKGVVEDYVGIERILRRARIETVFHLAAINVNIGTGVSPLSIFETNIRGTYSVLEACRLNHGVEQIVIASSREAEENQVVVVSGSVLSGVHRKRHPYQVSKISAELVAQAYCDTYGLPVCIARSDNVYGGRDLNWMRLIPGTIRLLMKAQAPVIRSDGSLMRDYVYIEDMVEAYLRLAAKLRYPEIRGEVFHFATGVSTSALLIVSNLCELVGQPDLKPVVLNESTGERINQERSTERERTLLGWESRVDIAQGLRLTVDWYRNYFGSLKNDLSMV